MPASSTPGHSLHPTQTRSCTIHRAPVITPACPLSFSRAICRYYTVGLNELADMQTNYTFGLQWTPHTKIKGALKASPANLP